MADAPMQEIKLFYCYAREDKPLRDELEKHLSWLKRRYHLTNWHDREILPGEEWEQAIDKNLNTAHLIFLLISPDFMASDYCFGNEMQRALERHKAGTCRVVPILLRPTYWKDAPFSPLQLLPIDARPVTRWPDRDEAFENIVTEISRTIEDLLISIKTKKEELLKKGNDLISQKRYDEALTAFEQAIRLDPTNSTAYRNKGTALYDLKRYQEALTAYNQAIRLDPTNSSSYNDKGSALHGLGRYNEALAAYGQAIRLDPTHTIAYNNKGSALLKLGHYQEALAAYDQAIRLNPQFASPYNGKGRSLYELKRYQEALAAYDQAIRLKSVFALAYYNKGDTLKALERHQEAEQAYEKARQLGFSI